MARFFVPRQEGASIEQIEAALAPRPSRRTLQRWLSDLIKQQHLYKVGQARGTRYRRGQVVSLAAQVTARAKVFAHAEILIPLSDEAKVIEAHVRQPLQKRTTLPATGCGPVNFTHGRRFGNEPAQSILTSMVNCPRLELFGYSEQFKPRGRVK